MTMFHKVLFWLAVAVSVLLPACPRAEDAILRIAKSARLDRRQVGRVVSGHPRTGRQTHGPAAEALLAARLAQAA